jgi:hypothetical protein
MGIAESAATTTTTTRTRTRTRTWIGFQKKQLLFVHFGPWFFHEKVLWAIPP